MGKLLSNLLIKSKTVVCGVKLGKPRSVAKKQFELFTQHFNSRTFTKKMK